MRLAAAVFALLFALVAGMGGAVAAQPALSGSMSMVPTTASAADDGRPAIVDPAAADAAAVVDFNEAESDPDDRIEAIACSACELQARVDALLHVGERPGSTPRPWLARLLRPPRTARG